MRDPVKAIAEFVWNAPDANATAVYVEFTLNGLGGMEGILIRDNGTGITRERAEHDFESLGEFVEIADSTDPEATARTIHGKEGQGRLRFFSLAEKACWSTVYKGDDGSWKLTINIDAGNLRIGNVSNRKPPPPPRIQEHWSNLRLSKRPSTGSAERTPAQSSTRFCPLRPTISGDPHRICGNAIDPALTIERSIPIDAPPLICPGRTVKTCR